MDQDLQVQKVLDEVPPPERVDPKAPPHVLLHGVPTRSLALAVLTGIAVLAMLRWAAAFFIPLMLGFVFYYALAPVVEAMARLRVPRALGAGVLILAILGGMGATAYAMTDDANAMIDSLPEVAQKLRDVVHRRSSQATPLDTVQKAAAELERAADEANSGGRPGAPQRRDVQRVVVEKPRFDIRDHLWSGTMGLASLIGQVTLVTFLTYFLLMSGDTFRRKLVKITGPSLSQKKLTVQALDEINAQMQRYLMVQLLVSVGEGVLIAVVFAFIGVNHAAVWGVAAGVLNLIPYIGSALLNIAAALVAFVQFGDVQGMVLVGGVTLAINTIKGYLIVPWLTSRTSRMNAVAVFIGVLVWGWLWGVWGLLLGIPIMMVIKAVCDRVDDLKPLGELLGT